MLTNQLSVFIENKPGRLSAALGVLAEGGVDISALSLADTSEYGILRLIVSDNDKAKAVLKDAGIIVKITPVLAISMNDVPGGLSHILEIFAKNNINVDYMYAFVGKQSGKAITVVKVSDPFAAEAALSSGGIDTTDAKDIYRL